MKIEEKYQYYWDMKKNRENHNSFNVDKIAKALIIILITLTYITVVFLQLVLINRESFILILKQVGKNEN